MQTVVTHNDGHGDSNCNDTPKLCYYLRTGTLPNPSRQRKLETLRQRPKRAPAGGGTACLVDLVLRRQRL